MINIYPNHSEASVNSAYCSIYKNEKKSNGYWVYKPNMIIDYPEKEFTFYRETNSLGLSEKEFKINKEDNLRIIALGDSFTEGSGVDYDSTWLKKVEKKLQLKNIVNPIETINAGIGGSDPLFQYILLKDKLISYQPDIVIMSINSSDISDINFRGDMDRFNSDGTYELKAPKWEWIYGINRTTRLLTHNLFGLNHIFQTKKEANEGEKKSIEIIQRIIDQITLLSTNHQFELLVVIHPTIEDFLVEGKNYHGKMNHLVNLLSNKNIHFLDLKSKLIDPEIDNEELAKSIYWPLDKHFNQKGYNLYGDKVTEKIIELGWIED